MNTSNRISLIAAPLLVWLCFLATPRTAGGVTVTPDYTGIEIPPNIAPLNFDISGTAAGAKVTFSYRSDNGSHIDSSGNKIRFGERAWREFISANACREIIGILTVDGATAVFTNRVSAFAIDSHLTYRLIPPSYSGFSEVGIYQRDLTSFKERPLYRNSQSDRLQCVNCHTYNAADPQQYLFHSRAYNPGTIVVSAKYGKKKIAPQIPNGYKGGVYPAWHPSGEFIAFSCNETSQIFYERNPDKIEVMDSQSDLFLYSLQDDKVTMVETDPLLFECFPTWSPDGKFLVTSRARSPFTEIPADKNKRENQMQKQYAEIWYDLVVRTFNQNDRTFSEPRILIDAIKSKKSFTLPRISPDGRWLVFVNGPYGCFHIWHKSADLWMLDLKENRPRALTELNSTDTESYHCFSKDGRWMVFSSRRDDGAYTRPYIAAFNPETGKFSKPFILPVKDPAEHRRRMLSYNIPEFSSGPVKESPVELRGLTETAARPSR